METVKLSKQEVKLLQSCTSKDASKPTLGYVHFSKAGLAYSTDGHKAAAISISGVETSFNLKGSDLVVGFNRDLGDPIRYPENVDLLFRADGEDYQISEPKKLIRAIFAAPGLPLVKISFTRRGYTVNQGISGRWLDQTISISDTNNNTGFNVVLHTEHLKHLKLLKGFNSLSYQEGSPIIFRSEDTGCKILMMPIRFC